MYKLRSMSENADELFPVSRPGHLYYRLHAWPIRSIAAVLQQLTSLPLASGTNPQCMRGDVVVPVQVLYNKLCFLPLGKGLKSRQLRP